MSKQRKVEQTDLFDNSAQSKGGKARAEKLTAEERSSIARQAALARHNANKDFPKVTHKGDLPLSGIDIPCYVLDDGRRVISGRGMQEALSMVDLNTQKESQTSGARLDRYFNQKSLKPFIYKAKDEGHFEPVICLNGTSKINGYEATVLVDLCEAFLEARKNIALSPRQAIIAKQCEILVTAFAKTGIVALVDEATGYQDYRAKDALASILEEFISEELQSWTRTFPLDFYREIFRLKGWDFDPTTIKRPQVIGHYTNNFIYKRLAPGVLRELKSKEPKIDGRRKNKLFQWLNGEVGHPKLLAHIEAVKSLMKISPDFDTFKKNLDQVYPIIETTDLGFEIEKRS